MALDRVLKKLDEVKFRPRTLHVEFPEDLTAALSVEARGFFMFAYDTFDLNFTVVEWADAKWKDDPASIKAFFNCPPETRIEILAFLSMLVHEYSHKIDFQITPFGLQYYTNTFLEYLQLQRFIPQILDRKSTIQYIHTLVEFGDRQLPNDISPTLGEMWKGLGPIINSFYAWGDVSDISPARRKIVPGWRGDLLGKFDVFAINYPMEFITVAGSFFTFRPAGEEGFWYLRPLSLFETRAISHSFLYILELLKEAGAGECQSYYEKIYLSRNERKLQDYFFVLNIISRIYGLDDFHAVLKYNNYTLLRSVLITATSLCWYALQTPPTAPSAANFSGNPVVRLFVAFRYFVEVIQKKIPAEEPVVASALLKKIDSWDFGKSFYVHPIADTLERWKIVLHDNINVRNKDIWNPEVREHFKHIFEIARDHLATRRSDYGSLLGMPDTGNPLWEMTSKVDWELSYDDYKAPASVKEWFDIRADLYFTLNIQPDEVIKRIDDHFMAFLFPLICECHVMTSIWVSRFFDETTLKCPACGKEKTIRRDDIRLVNFGLE